ncbi:LppC family lipoprotein [Psychromonas sp. psych-6C06]|uniref:penicillin-binding protein activator n=1 Tax=Psychromonas sp. psych-6C06 TaxID=2058089 RepID=UPI000C344984|nr:penicillin-binding protein activator [Psychromonas sp. psych-6C06]PKF63419.1 LppC family lipoprotein [Psychromonas sp. psych-6C06]
MNVLLKKRISRYLTVIATITFISACTTTATPPKDVPPALFSELEDSAAFYLNKDEQLGSDENLIWQFLAVQALIKERKFVMADAVIASLQQKPLNDLQASTLNLLLADKFYAQNKLPETQSALSDVAPELLEEPDLIHYLKLQSTLYIRNEQPLEAGDTILLLAPRLTIDSEKQTYNDLLLAQLSLLSYEQLTQYLTEPQESGDVAIEPEIDEPPTNANGETLNTDEPQVELQTEKVITPVASSLSIDQAFKEGWYALAALYQKNKFRPNRLSRELAHWKAGFPEHPAQQFMPLALTNIAEMSPYQPDNIAILLPLSGRFERQGKAIQLGLLNAYYHQQKSITDEQSIVPKLHFFDTQTVDNNTLVENFKTANIDFVVGPLMKSEIEALLPLIETMPVLALNSIAREAKPSNTATITENNDVIEQPSAPHVIDWHYAFPLSPEDEAQQAAQMIHANAHKNPLVIAPNSNYGKRVANAFKAQWAVLTPESDVQVESHYFGSKAKLARFIDDVLHTDKSKQRINQMKAITGVPLETEVRSRRDVDAIYIVSKRDELILLKPFIDVSVSPFAQKIPLYASSRSHSADRNNMQNKELSNLVFSDNPFLLDPESELSKEVENAWKRQSFSTLRLFALGFDSYQLIEQLVYLQNNQDAIYKGLIGDISLSSDNSIEAKLSWAKYQNGVLFEVASPTPAE